MQLFLSVHSYVKREKEQRNAIYEKGEVPVSINCAEAFAPPLLQMNNAHWWLRASLSETESAMQLSMNSAEVSAHNRTF